MWPTKRTNPSSKCVKSVNLIFYVFLSLNSFHSVNGYLNFYLQASEVHRLLGVNMELFYVRNGTINEYAMNFVAPLASYIDSLHFTWESLAGRPLPYSIGVEVSDHFIIGPPTLNISLTGSVPTSLQTFSINLPCTGVTSADVTITIQISITVMPSNVTTLTFRRKKTCAKDVPPLGDQVHVGPLSKQFKSTNIFYTAVGCAIAFVIIIVSVSFVDCYLKNQKLRRSGKANNSHQAHTTYLTAAPRNPTSTSSYGSFRRMPSYSLIDERSKDLRERIAELTIKRSRVNLNNVILEGTFGRVYLGTYTNDAGADEEVIIKTATDHASQTQISLLLQEGMSMYSLNHKYILTILGVSIEDNTAPYLLYPYQNYSNMKVFLQKCKSNAEGVAHTLTTQEVVDMALQVIEAMQFLHKKHFLHKDIAARNCIIDDKLQVKIADNALSRDLFPSDYHCLGDNENRPVKWLAIESLLHKTFSASSDVWAFGVLLWELTTLAQQPYVEIDPFEMAAYLKDGYRLAQPINCPDELFAVMAYCWAMSAEERPTFSQLHVCLQDFYAQLIRYV